MMSDMIAVEELLETLAETYEPSDALVNSIQRYGVLMPILLNANGEIIDGRRRLVAAQRLGITDIPYEIMQTDGIAEDAAIGVATNAVRSRNFITEYEACKILRDAGHTTGEIAKLTGLTHQQVNGLWRFDNIIPEVWDAVREGRVSGNHIRQGLVKMSREQQLEALAAEKITWKLLREIRQADVERAWDELDLPDIDDGGAAPPREIELEVSGDCISAQRYNGKRDGCLHVEMLKDTIRFFEGRTGRPSSWKAAAEAIKGLWGIEDV